MPGEGLTHGPRAKKSARGGYHRFSRIIRHSPRDGLRLIRALLGDRLSCPHRSLNSSGTPTLASTGKPGPHDFAVRASMRSSHRNSSRPPQPASRS